MRDVRTSIVLVLVSLLCVFVAFGDELTGTWTNSTPGSETVALGQRVRWLSLTFETNQIARWVWVHENQTESRSGRYGIAYTTGPSPGPKRTLINIFINPATLANTNTTWTHLSTALLDRSLQPPALTLWAAPTNQVFRLQR